MPKSITRENVNLEVELLTTNLLVSKTIVLSTLTVTDETDINQRFNVEDDITIKGVTGAQNIHCTSLNPWDEFVLPCRQNNPTAPIEGFMHYNTELRKVVVCEIINEINGTTVTWRQLNWTWYNYFFLKVLWWTNTKMF